MPYFQKKPWPAFLLHGQRYDLSHLDEYLLEIADSKGVERQIVVTFEDHCFTRKWQNNDEKEGLYPECSRKPGMFCVERYSHSLLIRDHIAQAAQGDVWISDGEGFAIMPTVDSQGNRALYCILFDLIKVQALPFDLRLLVRTAYPLDPGGHLATHGNIRFRHLVALRVEGKMPPRNRDQRRKRPQIK